VLFISPSISVNTEITDNKNAAAVRGWIFYDAECAACVAGRNRTGGLFESRGFRWVPLQTPSAAERLGVYAAAFDTRMHLLTGDGLVRHNADAFGVLCRSVWWLWPLGALLLVPGFRGLARLSYDWFARNRYCIGGRCQLPADLAGTERGSVTRSNSDSNKGFGIAPQASGVAAIPRTDVSRVSDWLPLMFLPLAALLLRAVTDPWVFMWVLAFSIYGGCKWLTYRDTLVEGLDLPLRTRIIYLLLWPGMSLKEFAGMPPANVRMNVAARWFAALTKTMIGIGLVWFAVPIISSDVWLLRGWVGMIGLIMMLHFGTFHLLALTLQSFGFNARPNMRAPLLARSLADFWGRRWNTAFNVLADRYGFRPLTARIGARGALAVVFLVSGVIHELVITLPAGGGYGLPTLYFALQAAGLFTERHPLIRRRPWLNRLFTWFVLLVPLGCLFPPVFVHNIILPMLHALGAI
jgi:predicted DCC family thiol-disulfide oxidoreductase YuxK